LKHPENSGIPRTGIYDGELGNFNRFTSSLELNATAGQTCGFMALFPGTGNGLWQSGPSASTAMTFAFSNSGIPGSAFLNTNAAKVRGIACKIELIPAGASITNITGDCAAGVTTGSSFISGTTAVNHLFDMAKASHPLQRQVVTSNWYPGSFDHTYNVYNTAPSGDDYNCVYIAYRGWPAGVPLIVRMTYVVEWTVKPNLGLPVSHAVSSPVGHPHVLAALHHRDPHWHHSLLDEVKGFGRGLLKDVGEVGRYVARTKLSEYAGKMLKAAPSTLPYMLEMA